MQSHRTKTKGKSEMQNESTASQPNKRFDKAIIMGASIAGLWTARALADHFEEVIIFEAEHLPIGTDFRSGAPQVRQFHTLLRSGIQQMQTWFPGLYDELIAAGAIPYDVINDVHLRLRNRWYPLFPSGYVLLSCSRLLLESSIRRRLKQNPRVHFVEGVDVVGLQSDETKQRITGVHIRTRGASSPAEADTAHLADHVIAPLGSRSQTPEWQVQLGYPAPHEDEVDSFLGYVTRKYKRKPNTPMILVGATPPNDPYAALVFPEEDDTMVALIAGYNKNYPPTEPGEFEAFAKHLGPEFQEALKDAEPISQPYGYRGTSSRWRHYEQLKRWPARYIVLGDAFCGFNPIYGQGMSVAALSAAALAKQLQNSNGDLDGVAQSTLREISKITQGAWLLATSADLEWPGTQGGTIRNSQADRFGRWYVDKLLDATAFDKHARLAFIAVQQLIKPASSLFAPEIFFRVLKHILLKKRG